MDFKTSGFMYCLGGAVVLFVIIQSLFFMIKAIKRGRKIGIDKKTIKNTIVSSALFTVAPSIAILATVITLAGSLGLVLPWIRLTVIGNISYEATAAESAASIFGQSMTTEITDPTTFGAIAWVMTVGSIMPLILLPILLKKVQNKIGSVASNNSKWADLMSAAAFIGLISAFIAKAIAGKGVAEIVGDGAGILSVATLLSAIIIMTVVKLICDKFSLTRLEPFAMPFSMIGAMGIAMLLAEVLPEAIAFLEWRG